VACYAYRDRPLSEGERERLRLALSSFRDGSGQTNRGGRSLPGFRDYERSLAAVLGGVAPENKGVFDVAVATTDGLPFGISCKMARFPPENNRCSFMELSNAAAKFRNHLLNRQITYASEPMLAGPAVIDLVSSWHVLKAPAFNLADSRFSVLSHDEKWEKFQILCFPLNLSIANPRGDVDWHYEGSAVNGYIDHDGRRHRLWQYYPTSGGQLKYYPLLDWAEWVTPKFTLEQPPLVSPLEKAQRYFSSLWPVA
jgi:hypothetical protein